MHGQLATLLGYDARVLGELLPAEQRTLDRLAEAWLLSSVLLACPVAYALWLIEHSLLLSALAALGAFLLVLLLLRLNVAGGGAAPHLSERELSDFRPAFGPTSILTLLTLLLSQPAQLPLWHHELAPVVEAHAQTLAAERAALVVSSGAEAAQPAQPNEFLVLRLQSIWQLDPLRALRLTLLYLLIVMQPALWSRFFSLATLRAYERARYAQMRKAIRRARKESELQVARELRRWSP